MVLLLAKPFNRMRDLGAVEVRYVFPGMVGTADLAWADVVVFCRPAEIDEYGILVRARRMGRKVFVTYDDDLTNVPNEMPLGRYYASGLRQRIMQAFLRHSDAVVVYNDLLASRLSGVGAHVVIHPQLFDFSLVEDVAQRTSETEGPITIAYPTSRGGTDTLGQTFLAAWPRLPGTVASRLRLHVWGAPPVGFEGFPNLVVKPFSRDYDAFVRDLAATGYDLGVAPLVDDPFHACKTELKFREYGGCGIPAIYSDAPPYNLVVRDGVTGILAANSPDSWARAITRLASDPGLRRDIAREAKQEVSHRYSLERTLDAWQGLLDQTLAMPDGGTRPRPVPILERETLYQRARAFVRKVLADQSWLQEIARV